jgi:hypothetical protein
MNYQKYVKKELTKHSFLNEKEKDAIIYMPWGNLHVFFELCHGMFSMNTIEQIEEEIFTHIIKAISDEYLTSKE